jgi:hypothetical protein
VEERKKFETLRNEKAELRRRVRQLEEEISNRQLEKKHVFVLAREEKIYV